MRNKLLIIVVGVLLDVSASPQEAAVAELNNQDSVKAADLYKRFKAAEEEWAAFKGLVQQKYGSALAKGLPRQRVTGVQGDGGRTLFEMPSEWSNGIEFSTDFRFVVPAPRR